MARFEDLMVNAAVKGVLPDALVTVLAAKWYGTGAPDLTYKDPFQREPDFGVTGVNYAFAELVAREGEAPSRSASEFA